MTIVLEPPTHSYRVPCDRVSAFIVENLGRCMVPLRVAVLRHGLDESEIPTVEQAVRIRLWRAAHRSIERTDRLSWSYLERTVASSVRDVRRRRCAHHGLLAPSTVPLEKELLHADGDVLSEIAYAELCDTVRECVRRLAPARQSVVSLHLEGADRRSIARQFGWSEGRVRNLLSRGLGELRESLTACGISAAGVDEAQGTPRVRFNDRMRVPSDRARSSNWLARTIA